MKHKRLFSFALAAALLAALGTGIHAAEPIDIGVDTGDTGGAWLEDTPTITAYDVETHFQDYAQDGSKVTFPQTGFALFPRELPGGSAVGVVLDLETDAPLGGATIEVDGNCIVMTDENGRFQINHMPDGFYDWRITADDYYPGTYRNYDINECDGASIFTFYLSSEDEITQNHLDYIHQPQPVPPPEAFESSELSTQSEKSMSSLPNISNKTRIKVNGIIKTPGRQQYIATVVASESFVENVYLNAGLTSSEVTQLYCAQAIAANTWLEYTKKVYSNHTDCDACNNTCCQKYDPSKTNDKAASAASMIFYMDGSIKRTAVVLHEPSDNSYDYIWSAFFSTCEGQGTWRHKTEPALKSVPCTDLSGVPGTKSAHHYGMCQLGAAELARRGYNAAQIMRYYYNSCDVELCPLVDT